ncbi:hypothetical protein K493DRAFT_311311 [Basidiobolus meristosporus CBS 931.73]|uniref:Phospholipid/glycerol acyltransferase domain-containing protein n=1 Tax=Basidiobolus meristosporus CBS 931.73 TaxID=1314790 RepID=A0A1Y1Z2U4_9FUNG|nr:hypothetical protein K493DRAFT_311311 [Basidiobolus meristosporus CBS 931.73]|eukprot:ORY04610.1 hypothetical protein K493DRAFT_311311 [Basidiobolus meristosporus CBS 931.73]
MLPFVYSLVRFFIRLIFLFFFREYGSFGTENVPVDKQEPVLLLAGPHGNYLLDIFSLIGTCPRFISFLSSISVMEIPLFGSIAKAIGTIPVTRPQDAQRIEGEGLVTISEDLLEVHGNSIGQQVQVGDTLYVTIEDRTIPKQYFGVVSSVASLSCVMIQEPGMKVIDPLLAGAIKNKKALKSRKIVRYGSINIRLQDGMTEEDLKNLGLPADENMQKFVSTYLKTNSKPHPTDDQPAQLTDEIVDSVESPLSGSFSFSHPLIQSGLYSTVWDTFSSADPRTNKCLAIFPEGVSTDYTHLNPLKYGCTVMSLGYLARNPGATLTVVPCGIYFGNRHKFRSDCYVEYGNPLRIRPQWVTMYAQGGEAKRQASQEFLQEIQNSLETLVLNAADEETLRVYQTTRRLYQQKYELSGQKLTVTEKLQLTRRIAQGYQALCNADGVRLLDTDLSRRLLVYANRIYRHGLIDSQVVHIRTSISFSVLLRLLANTLELLLVGMLIFPGALLFGWIGILARWVGNKQGKSAMLYYDQALPVTRWPGRDLIATWKIIICIFFFPLMCCLYSVGLYYLLQAHRIPLGLNDTHILWAVAGVCVVGFPVATYFTIRFGEVFVLIGRRVVSHYWSLRGWGKDLVSLREELRHEVCDLVENQMKLGFL